MRRSRPPWFSSCLAIALAAGLLACALVPAAWSCDTRSLRTRSGAAEAPGQLALDGLFEEPAEEAAASPFAELRLELERLGGELIPLAIDAEFRHLGLGDVSRPIAELFARRLDEDGRRRAVEGCLARLVRSLLQIERKGDPAPRPRPAPLRELAERLAESVIQGPAAPERSPALRWMRERIEARSGSWIWRELSNEPPGLPAPGSSAEFTRFAETAPLPVLRLHLALRLEEIHPLALFQAHRREIGSELADRVTHRYLRIAEAWRRGGPGIAALNAEEQEFVDLAASRPVTLGFGALPRIWLQLASPEALATTGIELLREIQRSPRQVELARDLRALDAIIRIHETFRKGPARTQVRDVLGWVMADPRRPELRDACRSPEAPAALRRAWAYTGEAHLAMLRRP